MADSIMPSPFGLTVLPQFQGDVYDLQRQQALAQALMQTALTPQMPLATGSGPYSIVPQYTVGQGLSQLGSALLAARLSGQVSPGLGTLGAAQWEALTGASPTTGD